MKLSYWIFDPTKNITALVPTPVPRKHQPRAAAELMARLPQVEQVGFLESPALPGARVRLQMMGGEFCGNAAMSAAAALALKDGLPRGDGADFPLEVSGAAGVLTCHLTPCGGGFSGTVAMPLPEGFGTAPLPIGKSGETVAVPAVRLPGIVHCVVPVEALDRQRAERLLRPRFASLCRTLGTEACGVLLFDEAESAFAPYVYVASTDTAVWESGCGSGSAALGAYLALRRAAERGGAPDWEIPLRQPGGVIRVRVRVASGAIAALSITGQVRAAGGGTLELPDFPAQD